MPIQTTCPACSRTLRVPDDLIGKNVRCPSCQTTFIAQDADNPPPLPRAGSTEAFRDAPAEASRLADETYRAEGEQRAAPPPLPPPEEDYDDDEELASDDERRYSRRRRAQYENAVARVQGPAIALMVTGGLSIAWAVLNVVLRMAMGAGRGGPFAGGNGGVAEMAGNIVGMSISLILGALIVYGALEMKKLRSFGMAITAAIIAIIPCHGCCLLGIPFGIWALVVLNDAEVKASFK